jgi:hypothetical protein
MQRLTLVGSDAVEATAWATVSSLTRDAGMHSGVQAVLLGGSLGRGEGTVIADRLASDIELYIVGRDRGLRSHAASLEQDWRSRGHDVSVAWLHPTMLEQSRAKNLSYRPSRTIRLYELASAAVVLAGSRPQSAHIDPTRLPVAEGVRLILNRLAEAGPRIARGSEDVPRWLDKILMAAGDTLLLEARRYTARYRDRLDALTTVGSGMVSSQDLEAIRGAYERKLWGLGETTSLANVAAVAEAVLREVLQRSPHGPVHTEWAGFPAAFAQWAARDETYLRYLPPIGPAAVYEAIVGVVRVRGAGLALSPRVMWNCVRGRPLSLLLQGCAAPVGLGLLTGRTADVFAGAAAMAAAGVPMSVIGDRDVEVADTLHRYWTVTA